MSPFEYSTIVFVTCIAIYIVPGPIFFLSINEALHGFKRGTMMMLGVLTAQSVLLIFLNIGFIIILQHILNILRIVGTALLLALAGSAIRGGIRGINTRTNEMIGTPYTRGFLLTFLNPPFILWFITVGSTLLETGVNEVGALAFILFSIILLATSVIVMLAIILSVHSGKRLIGIREIRVLSIISGIGFIIIAIILIFPMIPL